MGSTDDDESIKRTLSQQLTLCGGNPTNRWVDTIKILSVSPQVLSPKGKWKKKELDSHHCLVSCDEG